MLEFWEISGVDACSASALLIHFAPPLTPMMQFPMYSQLALLINPGWFWGRRGLFITTRRGLLESLLGILGFLLKHCSPLWGGVVL